MVDIALLLYTTRLALGNILPQWVTYALLAISELLVVALLLFGSSAARSATKTRIWRYLVAVEMIFAAMAVVGYFRFEEMSYSGIQILRTTAIPLSFVLGFYAAARSSRRWLVVIFGTLLVQVAVGVLPLPVGRTELIDGVDRASGVAGGVQNYANLALLLLSGGLYGLLNPMRAARQRIFYIAAALGAAGVLASVTLKSVVALGLAGISYLWGNGKKWAAVGALTVAIAASVVLILPISQEMLDRLGEAYATIVLGEVTSKSSVSWRLDQWLLLLDDWSTNYLFLGAGLGNVPNMDGFDLSDGRGYEAHSDLVMFICEGGILFGTIIIYIYWKIYREIEKTSMRRGLTKIVQGMYLVLALAGLFGNVFYSLACLNYIWFVIGCGAGVGYRDANLAQQHKKSV